MQRRRLEAPRLVDHAILNTKDPRQGFSGLAASRCKKPGLQISPSGKIGLL
jgi:hypothetical protein